MTVGVRKQYSAAELRAKKVYRLAYHRAMAQLKKRHEEEFRELLEMWKKNIVAEEVLTGDISSDRAPSLKHYAGEDGACVECGERSPCAREKRRERARARAAESAAGE